MQNNFQLNAVAIDSIPVPCAMYSYTDPGIRSLPLSPPYKPLVRDYPCPHADNLKETFRKYVAT